MQKRNKYFWNVINGMVTVNKQAEISFGAAYFAACFHLAACFPFMDSSGSVKDVGGSFLAARGEGPCVGLGWSECPP